MSRYSISGYIVALRTRTKHTVLAEGKYDQIIIKHCLLKDLKDRDHLHSKYLVDTAEVVESDGLQYSNGDKVTAIHAEANRNHLLDKITCFVDREFRWFDLSSEQIDLFPHHKMEADSLFYTRGHSIENYFFDKEMMLDYLEFKNAKDLTPNYRTVISENWTNMVVSIAALSLAITDAGIIGRCEGMLNRSHWRIDNGQLALDKSALELTLSTRNVDSANREKVKSSFEQFYKILMSKPSICRWLTHGHIGLNAISSGIAKLANLCGMADEACDALLGYVDWKVKYLCEKWHLRHANDENYYPVLFFKRVTSKIQ